MTLEQVHLGLEPETSIAIMSAWQRIYFSQSENEALTLSLSQELRRLNLGHELCRMIDLEDNRVEDCLLVSSDAYLTPSDFLTIIRRCAAVYEQASILIHLDGDIELVSAQGDSCRAAANDRDHPDKFSPDGLDHYVTQWQSRPCSLRRLGVGYEAKARQQLGFMSGWAVDISRKQAVRQTMPERQLWLG